MIGVAPSGVAAERLQDETGIASVTLHRLLEDARHEGGLPRASVVVVDEAGMAETRVLARVLELVEQAEGKVILIGDPHQLPAVGAGGSSQASSSAKALSSSRRTAASGTSSSVTRSLASGPASVATTSPTQRNASGCSSPRAP